MSKTNKILIHSILSFCIASLTLLFAMAYKNTPCIKIISSSISFIIFEIVLIKFDWILLFTKQSYTLKILAAIVSFLSVDLIRRRYETDSILTIQGVLRCSKSLANNIFYLLLTLGIIALFVYYIYLLNYIYRVIYVELLKRMDNYEKIFFFTFMIIMGLISLNVHIHTSAFDFTQYLDTEGNIVQIPYDAMMDCDSVSAQWNMKHFDFALRHPILAIVTLPEYSIASALGNIFPLAAQWKMAFLSLFGILKIAICGLCIKRMSNSKLSLIIYFISFPVLIYSLVIERHVWMLFWDIIMVYSYIILDSEHNEDYMPIMQAGGANLIGVLITPVVMKVKSIDEFIKKGIILAISFFTLIIVSGNLAGLVNIYNDLYANTAHINIDFLNNIQKFTHAIRCCLGGIKISYHSYYSTFYDESGISVIGIMISIVIIIALILLRENRYARLCGYWVGISVLLFPVIGFSHEDFSMHMILFSWAFISLIVMLYEFLKRKLIYNKIMQMVLNIFVVLMIIWEAATNLCTLNELISYANRFNNLTN